MDPKDKYYCNVILILMSETNQDHYKKNSLNRNTVIVVLAGSIAIGGQVLVQPSMAQDLGQMGEQLGQAGWRKNWRCIGGAIKPVIKLAINQVESWGNWVNKQRACYQANR